MRGTDTIDYSEHPEFSDDEEENAYFAAVRRNSHVQKNVQNTNTENAKKPRLNGKYISRLQSKKNDFRFVFHFDFNLFNFLF